MAAGLKTLIETLVHLARPSAAGAGAGAGVGALTDPEDPERGALRGAAAGALAGPLGTAALGAGRVGFGTVRSLAPAGERGLKREAARDAERDVIRWLGLEGSSVKDLSTALEDAARRAPGAPSTLADVGGEGVASLAEASARVPGPARAKAREVLGQRQAAQKARLKSTLDALSPRGDAHAVLEELEAAKRKAANASYGDVYQKYPALSSQALNDLIPVLDKEGALDMADRLATIRREAPMARPTQLTSGMWSLRDLDLAKRGLDAVIAGEKNPTVAGQLKGLRREYLNAVDALTGGDYAKVRDEFREFATAQDAVTAGRAFDKGDFDEVLSDFEKYSPQDQDAFRVGARRRIEELIDSGVPGVGTVRQLLERKGSKLNKLFATPRAYDAFRADLERELKYAETYNRALAGSPTQPREALERARRGGGADLAGAVATGQRSLTGAAFEALLRNLGHDPQKLDALTAGEVTNMLLNPEYQANVATLKRLGARAAGDRRGELLRGAATQLAPAAGGAAAAAGTRLSEPDRTEGQEAAVPGMAAGGRHPVATPLPDEDIDRVVRGTDELPGLMDPEWYVEGLRPPVESTPPGYWDAPLAFAGRDVGATLKWVLPPPLGETLTDVGKLAVALLGSGVEPGMTPVEKGAWGALDVASMFPGVGALSKAGRRSLLAGWEALAPDLRRVGALGAAAGVGGAAPSNVGGP